MKTLITRLSRMPVLTLMVVAAITVVFGIATFRGFRIETDLDEYMPNHHPAFVFARQAEEQFNIADGVLVAIYHPEGIYRQETLEKVVDLGRALGEMDGIEADDVMSLATADNISSDEWGLEVRPFMAAVPSSEEGRERLKEAVRGNPMIHGRIVSEDGTATLIIARPAEGGFADSVYEEIRNLVADYEGPEEIFVAGRPIVEGALAQLGPADMARMGPIVLVVIALVLLLVLRSVRNMILSMLIVGMSVIWAFGLMTMLGIPIYAVSTMIPVMLVAIGVAYSIHVFNSVTVYLEDHPAATSRNLADHAIETITRPVVMAAITTIVGFLSLLSSAVLPVRYFGLFTAFGVFSAMILSLALIPSSFILFGVKPPWKFHKKSQTSNTRIAEGIVDILIRRWKPIIIVAAALVVLGAAAIPRVWIDSSFLSNFEKNSDIAQTDSFVNEYFAGTSTINIILEADKPDVFKQPEVLTAMANLQNGLEADPKVGDTFALTDFIKRMHQVMHEEDDSYYAIPESQDLIAQYLLLYEMSADPESLEQVIDYEYRRANLTVQVKDDSSQTLAAIITTSDTYSEVFADFGISVHYAGSGYRALIFSELILKGQITSLLISLAIVVVLLTIMFRSVVIGLIGAVPIAITAVLNFGVMGLFGIPLSISTALISSIAVGIGIDYAIHVIERYKEYFAANGDRRKAAIMTMHHSGRAIMYNAVVVASGFAVLLFSVFPPNRQVGGLVALNMAVSFTGTVTVLFLLLYLRNRNKNNDHKSALNNVEAEETNA